MNRIIVLALLTLCITGCRIDFSVDGEGRVTRQSGNFDCDDTGGPDCTQTYSLGATEIFTAEPAAGFTFEKWTGCTYLDLFRCSVTFNDTAATAYAIPMKATFAEINPPVQTATYTHNALGQRITKTIGSTTTIFQYDLSGNLIAELDETGQPLREHIHVNNEPIAQLTINPANQAVSVAYVHPDHLGTPTLLTNAQDQVVVDIEATPFGETYVDYTAVDYGRRFPGQYKDEETGLHYNYFRDYDPSLGRYIQADPIGILRDYSDPQLQVAISMGALEITGSAGELLNHNYGYVGQNPLFWIDPYGLAGRKGERGYTGKASGTKNPYKHMKPHPTKPDKVIVKDPQTGKKVVKPKPPGFNPKLPLLVLPYDPTEILKTPDQRLLDEMFKDVPPDC